MEEKDKSYLLWDNDKSIETLIFRALMWEDVKTVLKEFDEETLKKVFLKYYFKFDERNQNFWKIVLNIDENEFNKSSKREFEKDS